MVNLLKYNLCAYYLVPTLGLEVNKIPGLVQVYIRTNEPHLVIKVRHNISDFQVSLDYDLVHYQKTKNLKNKYSRVSIEEHHMFFDVFKDKGYLCYEFLIPDPRMYDLFKKGKYSEFSDEAFLMVRKYANLLVGESSSRYKDVTFLYHRIIGSMTKNKGEQWHHVWETQKQELQDELQINIDDNAELYKIYEPHLECFDYNDIFDKHDSTIP